MFGSFLRWRYQIVKFITTIVIFLVTLALINCQGDKQVQPASTSNKKEIVIEKPTKEELDRVSQKISLSLKQELVKIPSLHTKNANLPKELCDGKDNNGNGFVDENCFGCFHGAIKGDFDGDGEVTLYDCTFPLLYAKGLTIVRNDATCADLDHDGRIGIGDALRCLDIVHSRDFRNE